MSINEMGKNDLREACKTAGIKGYGNMTNDAMRAALGVAAAPIEAVVTTPAAVEPAADAAPAEAALAKKPKAAKAVKAPKTAKAIDARNGVTRPREGSACRLIWDLLDSLKAKGEDITYDALRAGISTKTAADATIRTQRQRYKTFNA